VVAFELAEWQRTYAAALATPVGALDNARRGSTWFGERCVGCHKVRGVGGERGPDLTRVAARLEEARFSEVLAAHPGWVDAPGDVPGPAEAADVWSFLRAVSAATAYGAPEPEPDELRAESGKREADAP
jgi:mono/diheme cytochrome c family protein